MKQTLSEKYFLWGVLFLVLTLVTSLGAYYLYSPFLRQFAFAMMIVSLLVLLFSMATDLAQGFTSHKWLAWGLVLLLVVVYFGQRTVLSRFDFMIGDASDYFAAGLCSVTYSQDIGYILPLSATITALGYEIFGIKYVLLSYVILYATSIPIFYFLFRKLQLTYFLSFIMSVFLVFVPLSIWFSKTSFTEPIWQIILFMFVFNMYMVLQKNIIEWKNLISIYLILFLAPMLRVEGVFYYGLLFYLVLHHLVKYKNIQTPLILSFGLYIVAISTHITLRLRPDYLLNRQFNRIIPHATEENVMIALYALATGLIILLGLIYLIRKRIEKVPFSSMMVIFLLVVKIMIAYLYATKKHMTFLDMVFMHEYGLTVGNFGLPITILIFIGLCLLYAKAFSGEMIPLLLVVVYTIFYLPFSMQAVSFYDPHAFFLYWNRYYFSVLMIIHLLGLGLFFQKIYNILEKFISTKNIRIAIIFFIVFSISLFSINSKLYTIVVGESHLKGTYKLYTWVKKHVGNNGIYIVTEEGVVYKQNTRPDGLEQIEYMIGRMFSLHKIPEKGHEVITSKKLVEKANYILPKKNVKYILCVATKECKLHNQRLSLVDTLKLPLVWREHFGLDKNASSIHHGDVTKSVVKHIPFTAVLYRVDKKVAMGKKVVFRPHTQISSQMLKEGWRFVSNRSSAFAQNGKAIITLPKLNQAKKVYTIHLRYAIINASKANPKSIWFRIGGKVVKEAHVDAYTTREVNITLPSDLRPSTIEDMDMSIEASNKGQIMLRSIIISAL